MKQDIKKGIIRVACGGGLGNSTVAIPDGKATDLGVVHSTLLDISAIQSSTGGGPRRS